MTELFFSFDGNNYARYTTFFSLFLTNIEETHPGATDLLKLGQSALQDHMCQEIYVLLTRRLKKLLCDMLNPMEVLEAEVLECQGYLPTMKPIDVGQGQPMKDRVM